MERIFEAFLNLVVMTLEAWPCYVVPFGGIMSMKYYFSAPSCRIGFCVLWGFACLYQVGYATS